MSAKYYFKTENSELNSKTNPYLYAQITLPYIKLTLH